MPPAHALEHNSSPAASEASARVSATREARIRTKDAQDVDDREGGARVSAAVRLHAAEAIGFQAKRLIAPRGADVGVIAEEGFGACSATGEHVGKASRQALAHTATPLGTRCGVRRLHALNK